MRNGGQLAGAAFADRRARKFNSGANEPKSLQGALRRRAAGAIVK
jgi:hypothetical protein